MNGMIFMRKTKKAFGIKAYVKDTSNKELEQITLYPTPVIRARTLKKGSTVLMSAFNSKKDEKTFSKIASENISLHAGLHW